MNCLKKTVFILFFLFLTFIFKPFSSVNAQATDYLSVSLSPSPGIIYSDGSVITVSVDSGTANFTGGSFFLAYTGAVSYEGATGNAICTRFSIIPGTSSIEISCTAAGTQPYKGVLAVLNFKSTAAGSSVFSFTSTNPNVITKSGGNYTLSLEKNPNPIGGNETLPDSGLFDNSRGVFLIGVLLVLCGFFFTQISSFAMLLPLKVTEGVAKIEESKMKKRRNKLEKKY